MTLLGRLLKNRRAGEAHTAWQRADLRGPELLTLTSRDFADGGALPLEHGAKFIGGEDLSPHLAWTPPPPGTAQLLLVVEDIDVPLGKPAVHCLALVDPASGHLDRGALGARRPAAGVRLLRSTVGRGYHGPAPIKGHGPHHYVFQLFALATRVGGAPGTAPGDRTRPRAFLAALTASDPGTAPALVLARARMTGTFER
ncbi:YbhB/YbcL family Raf kinase inhibitor-like protein [Streptomyces corynorhini]|uniref:YbhB/YbcL family Raf kinase inhibitor-like protein n=1 Tax=Streptomyces corynorhini TaxID=2282652 RepID=A0A370B6G9_9ACTN|nr:YbhB/YbcL family Raf kinase inhibitor-like protein [Streptomyces corynorhini]RDG35346.1 YbhB/YbcL family Raf kinase inhibitor-like protein [Streptomyces corynorhini]